MQPHCSVHPKLVHGLHYSEKLYGVVHKISVYLLAIALFSCGSKQGNESAGVSDKEISTNEITVDWYTIADAGLLSIEKKGNDSISFSLMVGQGENCTDEASGIALLQDDGTYRYGDSDCGLTFKPKDNDITIVESGDLCDHGVHCTFAGDYSKVVSEKVSPASADILSWMRKSTGDFSCLLEKQFSYHSEKCPCGQTVAVDYDPNNPNWNEGPEFPQQKTKDLHPLVKNVSAQFEHGELYMLTITLEDTMILQDVQRIFGLPHSFESYGNDKYSNVMSLTYDDFTADDKPHFRLNPVYVTSFTLTGFEHMGAGDLERESEPVIGSSITYEYRETGNAFTLIDEGGPGPYEFTCTSIADIKTSSDLTSQGNSSYSAASIKDMNEATTWAEGKDGLGIGEWIEFTLTDAYKKWGYTDEDFISKAISGGFVIQTGYAKSPALWKKNSRPVKFKCYLNGQPISIIQIKDTPDFQTFGIFPEGSDYGNLKEGDVIRFEIMDVIKGTSDEDACISEFHLEGSCG